MKTDEEAALRNSYLLEKQKYAEKLLFDTLSRLKFYFSIDNYNLLESYQSNILGNSNFVNDSTFFWNKDVLSRFLSLSPSLSSSFSSGTPTSSLLSPTTQSPLSLREFITPFINGLIQQTSLTIGNEEYQMILLSRRSKDYQGPRYLKRGSDPDGNVANYVETEQILYPIHSPTKVSSCLQVFCLVLILFAPCPLLL
jgi:hypothetical protein